MKTWLGAKWQRKVETKENLKLHETWYKRKVY